MKFFTPFHNRPRRGPVLGTLELGDGGFNAVLSSEFDLLQLSASSGRNGCGILIVRGSFPDSSLLSRGQHFGFGFGCRIPAGPEYRIDGYLAERVAKTRLRTPTVISRGWLNNRWPITREEFQCQDSIDAATVEIVSFCYVKNGDVIQFSKMVRQKSSGSDRTDRNTTIQVPFKLGDRIRFGCSCTSPCSQATTGQATQYSEDPIISHDGQLLTYKDPDTRATLRIQGFIDGSHFNFSGSEEPAVEFGDATRNTIALSDKPVTVITIFSLRPRSMDDDVWLGAPPTPNEIERDLGVDPDSIPLWLLWDAEQTDLRDPRVCADDSLKMKIVGRALEYLLSVAAIPSQDTRPPSLDNVQPICLLSDAVLSLKVDAVTLL
jgi:hypothetical protein